MDDSSAQCSLKAPSLLQCSILIVEDNELLARFASDVLSFAGCKTSAALSVCSAFEALDRTPYDAVVLDLTLSGRSSLPVADELLRRGTPFVITSGHVGLSLQPRYRKAPYLTKPFTASDLLQAVERLLSASGDSRSGDRPTNPAGHVGGVAKGRAEPSATSVAVIVAPSRADSP